MVGCGGQGSSARSGDLTGFWAEGVTVDENEKGCFADLSVPGAAVT